MHLEIQLITNHDDLHITQNYLGRENIKCEARTLQCLHET